jgi:hypothetical protein
MRPNSTRWATLSLGLLTVVPLSAEVLTVQWPRVTTEARPGTRWWWLGSAVDTANLSYNLRTYADAGIGAVEITPIYGVQQNEANDINFLTDRWMEMLRHTETVGAQLGLEVDMNTGTGWPFGGPEVTLEEAATRAIFNRWDADIPAATKARKAPYTASILPTDAKELKALKTATLTGVWAYDTDATTATTALDVTADVDADGTLSTSRLTPGRHYTLVALWIGKTLQAVKRAAPGGAGYVMDHFAPGAVQNYLGKFDRAFARTATPYPHTFFNDSYEVYGADWTPALLTEFAARRGYRLEDHLPAFLDTEAETHARLVSDYRETLSDLLLETFTHMWTAWAHEHHAITRNQAHGSPANLLDVYAAVDIPEIEGFGLSDFDIDGLRRDTLTKKNDSDLSMLKYAASAAHITDKPYTSSETFTWLTEHFRTSLSQCKPDMDLMFVSGVNHCFFHGTTYSPREAAWPGYLFYAAMEMSPINTIWTDAPAFFSYITRCQSFLQWGRPDNDFLVYLPVYDIWHDYPGRLLQFDIHSMAKKAPKFIEAVSDIYRAGYDMDYISDAMLDRTTCVDGELITEGGTHYQALILPAAHIMQPATAQRLLALARQGATIVFVGTYPTDVPGLTDLDARSAQLREAIGQLPGVGFEQASVTRLGQGYIITAPDYRTATDLCHTERGVRPEVMKREAGVSCIRRSNPTGHHYFISSLQHAGVDGWVKLGVEAQAAVLFDPMTGRMGRARVRQTDGTTEVYLQLASGESCILQTYAEAQAADLLTADGQPLGAWTYLQPATEGAQTLRTGWTLSFPATQPAIGGSYALDTLCAWTELSTVPEARTCKGTARYTTTVKLSKKQLKASTTHWMLDLGDVRESAHLYVNGQDAGTLFAVPYRMDISPYLKAGDNRIEVDVTGLAANYVAEMDRQGTVWRRFKDANIANLKGGRVSYYGDWDVMPCGLNGAVRLVPYTEL